MRHSHSFLDELLSGIERTTSHPPSWSQVWIPTLASSDIALALYSLALRFRG